MRWGDFKVTSLFSRWGEVILKSPQNFWGEVRWYPFHLKIFWGEVRWFWNHLDFFEVRWGDFKITSIFVRWGEVISNHPGSPHLFPEVRWKFWGDFTSLLQILHRDIKLGNILLKDGSAKVADFGLAIDTKKTKQICICGTPNFLAPEVFQKRQHFATSDIWAAGCVLFCMLGKVFSCAFCFATIL